MKYFYILVALISAIIRVDCIMWNLEPNTQKCLKEELQKNVLITGEFEVTEAQFQKVDYVVCLKHRRLYTLYLIHNIVY